MNVFVFFAFLGLAYASTPIPKENSNGNNRAQSVPKVTISFDVNKARPSAAARKDVETFEPSADVHNNNSEAGSNNNVITDTIPRNARTGTSNNVLTDTVNSNADNSVPVHIVSIAAADVAAAVTDNAALGSSRPIGIDEILINKTESGSGIIGIHDTFLHVTAAIEDRSQTANNGHNEGVHAVSPELLNHSGIHSESGGDSAKMKSLPDNTAVVASNTGTADVVNHVINDVNVGPDTHNGRIKDTEPDGTKIKTNGKMSLENINRNTGLEVMPKSELSKSKIGEVTINADINKSSRASDCNVKNSTCVPTRAELIAAGATNVDFMQHRVKSGRSFLDQLKPKGSLVTDAIGTASKTMDSIVDNVGSSHIEIDINDNMLKETRTTDSDVLAIVEQSSTSTLHEVPSHGTDADINKPGSSSDCNVKNSTCVPTRAELIASGATTIDFMQHRVNSGRLFLDQLNPKGSSLTDALDTAPKTKDSIIDNVGSVYIKIDKNDKMLKEARTTESAVLPIVEPSSISPLHEEPRNITDADINKPARSSDCNVKNSTCVPTRAELIVSGTTNVDIMQYRMNSRPLFPIQLRPKGSTVKKLKATVSTSLSNINDIAADTPNTRTNCNVKNATCVPKADDVNLEGNVDSQNSNRGMSASSEDTPGVESSKSSTLNIKTPISVTTKVMQPSTIKQIPVPISPTQQTKSTEQTSLGSNSVTQKKDTFLVHMILEETTSAKATSDEKKAVQVQTCPNINCSVKCKYGKKVDSNGCETCECKFSDKCPMVHPASRLLCLLQVRSNLRCGTDADCQRTRICCPGTCGPKCRRPSRSRSMLLSMFIN